MIMRVGELLVIMRGGDEGGGVSRDNAAEGLLMMMRGGELLMIMRGGGEGAAWGFLMIMRRGGLLMIMRGGGLLMTMRVGGESGDRGQGGRGKELLMIMRGGGGGVVHDNACHKKKALSLIELSQQRGDVPFFFFFLRRP